MERHRHYQLVLLSSFTGLIIGGVWLAIVANQRSTATVGVSDSAPPASRSQIMKRRLEVLAEQKKTGQAQSYSYESASIPVEQPR
ncbi:MAG: hypothetical protein Q7S64_03405 [bacterium]|nr:hypothetical protein [bacterium]